MYYHDGNIHIEEEDQCVTCHNFNEGLACPLLQALAFGMVKLEDTLIVVNCGFYKEFKRHLKLLSDEEEKNQEPAPKSTNKVRNINSIKKNNNE